MDSHQLEGRWNEIKGELKSWWGKLTDDDIEQVAGNKDKLIGVVQQKYGYLYDATATVRDNVENLKAGTEDIVNAIFSNETFRNLRADVVQFVRRYPVQSLLIGFGIGYFLSRRSRR